MVAIFHFDEKTEIPAQSINDCAGVNYGEVRMKRRIYTVVGILIITFVVLGMADVNRITAGTFQRAEVNILEDDPYILSSDLIKSITDDSESPDEVLITPYPDFDLVHLSNVKILEEENENEYEPGGVTGAGKYSVDVTGNEAVEPDDEQDSGDIEGDSTAATGSDYLQTNSGIGWAEDVVGEPVDVECSSMPELVESGIDSDTEYGSDGEPEYSEGYDGESDTESGSNGNLSYLGIWTITAYCPCEICCGQWATGCTASGVLATSNHTVACGSLPFGTQVMIGDQIYTVEDTGVEGEWIDIFFDTHDEALAFGMRTMEVYLVE